MEWITILQSLFEICIIPLLGVLTTFLVTWIRSKTKEVNAQIDNEVLAKHIAILSEVVVNCVIATKQTYVDTLKKQGSFDEAAQKIAFENTYNAVINLLTEETKQYLITVYGDLNTLLTNLIEAEVQKNK